MRGNSVWRKRGIDDLHIHGLRHVAVTDLHEAGNSERAIASLAGWKSTAMMSRYWHYDGLKVAHCIRLLDNAEAANSVIRQPVS